MIPTIVIIGDSHVSIYSISKISTFFNVLKIIHSDSEDVTRFGKFTPYLMNTISNKGEFYLQHHIDKYQNANYIMYIFGEPDVRIHFDKQINLLNRNEDEVIETLCKNYIKKLIDITPKNIKIIVRYLLPQRIHSMYGDYVPRGNINDRVRYTNKMNLNLNNLCKMNGLLFLDNSEKINLVEDDGSLKDIYCDGFTHYNSNAVIYLNKEIDSFFNTFIKNTF